jgi:hypothetical protein
MFFAIKILKKENKEEEKVGEFMPGYHKFKERVLLTEHSLSYIAKF